MAQTPPNDHRSQLPSSQDLLTAAFLIAGLTVLFALTRSHWLDDWDSVNFALPLDDFDVSRHRPHPPDYPVYVAAGKFVHLVIADHAAPPRSSLPWAGTVVAAMLYLLDQRQNCWPVARDGETWEEPKSVAACDRFRKKPRVEAPCIGQQSRTFAA
jgi:hypothetical protein